MENVNNPQLFRAQSSMSLILWNSFASLFHSESVIIGFSNKQTGTPSSDPKFQVLILSKSMSLLTDDLGILYRTSKLCSDKMGSVPIGEHKDEK